MAVRKSTSEVSSNPDESTQVDSGVSQGVGGLQGNAVTSQSDAGRSVGGISRVSAEGYVAAKGVKGRRVPISNKPKEVGPSTKLNLDAVVMTAKSILELSEFVRTEKRLRAKASALAAIGLSEEESKVRDDINKIGDNRAVLLGLCDALKAAHDVAPTEVRQALKTLDPSGTLLVLLGSV